MKRFLLATFLLFTISCAHTTKQDSALSNTETDETEEANVTPVDASVPAAQNDLNDNETDLSAIPHEYNKEVQMWVNYFTGRGRPHMERYLSRSSRYMPKMKEILKQNGMPEDLVYISLIESGFSPTAHSWANAVGYWQFIRGTGKRYGLHIDALVDERRDFILSTHAAAGYYKDLYALFGSWYLAIASYNVGEGKVKRAVTKHYTRDFWALAKRRALPKETINYVPKYLAARMIVKHPERFGFTGIDYLPPLDFEEFKVNHTVDLKKLAAEIGADEAVVIGLNPAYIRGLAPVYTKNEITIRVPPGFKPKALAVIAQCTISPEALAEASSGGYFWYKVKRGDTIHRIARQYRVAVSTLKDINNLRSTRMYKGRRLKIPEKGYKLASGNTTTHPLEKNEPQKDVVVVAANESGYINYTVRKGDTLSKIATRHLTTVPVILAANKLKSKARLKRGTTLLIPTRVAAEKNSEQNSKSSIAAQARETYKVQPGDTLTAIAKKHGTQVQKIREMNSLGRRSVLYSGQELKIPEQASSSSSTRRRGATLGALSGSRVYLVKRGDNLTQIARKHGLSLSELVRINRLGTGKQVQAGQRLRLRN